MVYIYKEYQHIFDTPGKKEQESVIINKIMDLLNKNKYDNIYDFINKNQTYQEFLKNNNLETVIKHFGNTLSEEEFKLLLNEMVKLTDKKKSFNSENLQTTVIEDKEYNVYDDGQKAYFFDNSHSSMTLERQMEELQSTDQKFQTADATNNTRNMMEELEKNKKESFNLKFLNEINVDELNNKEKEIFTIAYNYQLEVQTPIRLDIERGIIVDVANNIMQIQKNDGKYTILGDNNEEKNIESQPETEKVQAKEKSFQKVLTPSPNTIYSNNN